MKNLLHRYDVDYESCENIDVGQRLSNYLSKGIVKRRDGCFTYRNNYKASSFALLYNDRTGNEASNNSIFIEVEHSVKHTLQICFGFIFKLSEVLAEYPDNFTIVLSYFYPENSNDSEAFFVSFYCNRSSEQWLIDDLEVYKNEAIFIMTTKGKLRTTLTKGNRSAENEKQFVKNDKKLPKHKGITLNRKLLWKDSKGNFMVVENPNPQIRKGNIIFSSNNRK